MATNYNIKITDLEIIKVGGKKVQTIYFVKAKLSLVIDCCNYKKASEV